MKLEAKARLVAKTTRPLTKKSSGTYVCVLPDDQSTSLLQQMASYAGLETDTSELHCTLSYSKGCFPKQATTSKARVFTAKVVDVQYWSGHDNDGYVVVILDSVDLVARNRYWTQHGLKHSFEDYTPHVTLDDKLENTPALAQSLHRLAERYVGTVLRFTAETIEGLKP